MNEPKPARPPQVTVAGWLVVAGSVAVVLMAFSQVTDLRSMDTREAVEEYLSQPPGDVFGIGVQRALSLLRIALMVAAACAAATAILGWQVLQRSRGARTALSLLAVPLFLSGLAGGGVISAVVVAAIAMLWFQPARDWFDGVTRAPLRPPGPLPDLSPDPARDPLLDLPPPTSPPLHPTPYAAARVDPAIATRATQAARPRAVVSACVLTWVFAASAFALLALTLVVMLADSSALIEAAHRQNPDLADRGVTDAVLRTTVYVTSCLVMVWSAAAAGLAVLVWRRVRWASTALVVSAAVAGAFCLLVVVGALVLLLPLAACIATVVLLLRPEARSWFRR